MLDTSLFHEEIVYSYSLMLLSIILFLYILRKPIIKANPVFSISILDIAVMGFVVYIIINVLSNGITQIENANICKWGSLVGIYILIRSLRKKKIVFYILIISGIEEAITAICQKVGWLESSHDRFDVTGNLGNPGPLGGFLAVCLIIAIGMLWKMYQHKKHRITLLLSIGIALMITGLVLADSRAAMIGLIIGGIILFPFSHFLRNRKKRITTLCALSIIFVTIGTLFYLYRPLSANARLLIWRVSSDMIADKPLSGHGIGAFGREYMFYQARYFANNNDTSFMMSADNVAYAYNELIHLAVEVGFIGLILFLSIIGVVFIKRLNIESFYYNLIRAGLATWLVFSLFSYPAEVFPLLLLISLLLGCVENKSFNRPFSYRKVALFSNIAFILTGGWSYHQGCFYQVASKELGSLYESDNTSTLNFVDTHYAQLRTNPKFRMVYNGWLCTNSSDIKDMEQVKEIVVGSETYCLLGDYYYRLGMNKAAEETYRIASFMVPTRMKPNYKLWRFYLNTGDCAKADIAAVRLLTQPLKVHNSFTINARTEVKEYLEVKQ